MPEPVDADSILCVRIGDYRNLQAYNATLRQENSVLRAFAKQVVINGHSRDCNCDAPSCLYRRTILSQVGAAE